MVLLLAGHVQRMPPLVLSVVYCSHPNIFIFRGPKIKFTHSNAKVSTNRHSCLPVFEPVKYEARPELSILRYRSPVEHALCTETTHSVGGHSAFFASQTKPWDRLQPSPCCSKTINLSSVLQMLCSWLFPHPLHPCSKGMQPVHSRLCGVCLAL